MSKIIILFVGFFLFTACSEAQNDPGTSTNQEKSISKVLSPEAFKSKMEEEGVQLIDVRTTPEIKGGKIENSVQMDYNGANFQAQLESLDKSKPVLVYCASGRRSGNTAETLVSMGFTEVYDLEGGFNGWPYK